MKNKFEFEISNQSSMDRAVKGICDKFNEMSIDGKSFTHIKFFDDDDDYVYWSEAKRKLPPIDEHLTYTLVSEEKFD